MADTNPPAVEETTSDFMLSVPYSRTKNELLKQQAARNGRSAAGHVRYLIDTDLQKAGLVDDNFKPVNE